jgi:hypothetical protein
MPSQSLSLPSQISTAGAPGCALQPLQLMVPLRAHSPTPEVHAAARPGKPSSTCPSQSLSLPSQISGDGITPLHADHAPDAHVRSPAVHTPLLREQGVFSPLLAQLAPVAVTQVTVPGSHMSPGAQVPSAAQCGTTSRIEVHALTASSAIKTGTRICRL